MCLLARMKCTERCASSSCAPCPSFCLLLFPMVSALSRRVALTTAKEGLAWTPQSFIMCWSAHPRMFVVTVLASISGYRPLSNAWRPVVQPLLTYSKSGCPTFNFSSFGMCVAIFFGHALLQKNLCLWRCSNKPGFVAPHTAGFQPDACGKKSANLMVTQLTMICRRFRSNQQCLQQR